MPIGSLKTMNVGNSHNSNVANIYCLQYNTLLLVFSRVPLNTRDSPPQALYSPQPPLETKILILLLSPLPKIGPLQIDMRSR
jgi:hypothetical protein